MKTPFFTVGILTFNYAEYIEQAIKSVLKQSFKNWEMIIYDDASIDNTEVIVSQYLYDKRISYIKQPKNVGQAANWRCLLNSGRGEVLCTLHADDYWENDILENVYCSFFNNSRLDIYCVNWQLIGINKKGPVKDRFAVGKKIFIDEIKSGSMLPSATFIKRSLVEKCEMPSTKYKLAVDSNYFLMLLLKSDFFQSNSKCLMNYRVHEQSASAIAYREGIYFSEVVSSLSVIKTQINSTELIHLINNKISENYFNSASLWIKKRKLAAARVDIIHGLKIGKVGVHKIKALIVLCFNYGRAALIG